MSQKSSLSQACAACKYQRRRCNPSCPLVPYFPADKPKMFQNAHRLFGVSNIMKILKQVRDDQKDEAMKSIIYEADMRERFPINGCSFVTLQLKEQLQQCQEELYRVNSWLATFRSKGHGQYSLGNEEYRSNIDISSVSNEDGYTESRDVKPALWIPSTQNYIGSCFSDYSPSEKSQFTQEIEAHRDYDDDMAFDTIAHDRHCYDSKDTCESSVESSLKDSMKSMDETSTNDELKIAAACFSLKSVRLGKNVSQ